MNYIQQIKQMETTFSRFSSISMMHAVFHCYLEHIHSQQIKIFRMKSQLFLSVFLYRIKKCSPAQDPHFTNRKQTNRKSKVVQEAKVKYIKDGPRG